MSPFLRPVARAVLAASIAGGTLGTGPVLGGTDGQPTERVIAALEGSAEEPPSGPAPTPSPPDEPSPDPSPGPDPSPPPVPAPWTGRFNLFQPTAWVRQYWSHTCTAASTQTMLNLVTGRADRSRLTQDRIIRYARRNDSLRTSKGSDPMGWAKALTYFGAGTYTWRTFPTQAAALRHAALRMLATGKPVGLLVWRGRHAWTMTGFTATADPRTTPGSVVTGIYVAPPLVGVDPKPNAYVPRRSLATFARYRERDGLRTWVNRWVVVAP